jgi:hypothetical protein
VFIFSGFCVVRKSAMTPCAVHASYAPRIPMSLFGDDLMTPLPDISRASPLLSVRVTACSGCRTIKSIQPPSLAEARTSPGAEQSRSAGEISRSAPRRGPLAHPCLVALGQIVTHASTSSASGSSHPGSKSRALNSLRGAAAHADVSR